MKWFKHDTDCEHSEGLSYLISIEGFAGYGRWFRLLEIVASKMDKTDRCCVEYPIQKWCSLLGLKQKKLISFLELTENKLKTKVVCYNNIIKIEIPNLLNKRDEYTRKSGESQENVPPKNKEERIKKKELKKKDILPKTPKRKKSTIPPDLKLSDEMKTYALEKLQINNGDCETLFESYKNHHIHKETLGVDWTAAWRTWVLNELKWNPDKYNKSKSKGASSWTNNLL